MNPILLPIPLISLVLVLRGKAEKAFLSVYLPCLLLLTTGFNIAFPHIPGLTVAQYTLLPIAIVALYRYIKRGSFALMDLLVLLYIVSEASTEITREPNSTTGAYIAIPFFFSVGLTYITGRGLIEPELRFTTVKRIVVLALILGPIGLYEWRMGISPYSIIGGYLHLPVGLGVQIRGSHGRLMASFGDAEIAGIAFGMTFALNGWLVYLTRIAGRSILGKRLAQLAKYRIPELVLLTLVWMTQSRGPIAGTVLAIIILQIPRFRNTRRGTIIVFLAVAIIIGGGYGYYKHYTSVNPEDVRSEQQSAAMYRRGMNEQYPPIAKKGGWLGWSATGVPVLPGMQSIDNEFLRVWLIQGAFGLSVLLLIVFESLRSTAVRSWIMAELDDRAFTFSLIGAFILLWATLTTVWMGNQLPDYVFLLLGWSQSIGVRRYYRPKFNFQRVFR